MKSLHVIHCIDAGNAALKYLVGHRSIKVRKIITQQGEKLTQAQEKLACCMVMMAGSGLKSAKKKRVTK